MPRIYLLLISLMLTSGGLAAQFSKVPVNLQAALMLKATKYDRAFEKKISSPENKLYIGIAYQQKFRKSILNKEEFELELEKIGFSAKIEIVELVIDQDGNLISDENIDKIGIIYITPMRGIQIKKILDLSKDHQILTVTGILDYADAGVTMSFDLVKDRPKFVINRISAADEGCDFSSQLLKLAIVH